MTDAEILTDFAKMAAAISQAEPYLLRQPGAWPTPEACGAYTLFPRVPGFVRDHLKITGEWRGYRPAIVFVAPLDDSKECRGIFVHELGHCLPAREPIADCDPSTLERDWQLMRFKHIAETPFEADAVPWAGHDLAFIRRCLHLHFRAVERGWALNFSDLIVAGRWYGLSHLLDYWCAIGDEPARMAGATFAEIEATKPPAEMIQLWESDTSKWRRRAAAKTATEAA